MSYWKSALVAVLVLLAFAGSAGGQTLISGALPHQEDLIAVRYKSLGNTGDREVYLGVPELGLGGLHRTDLNVTWTAGAHDFALTYDPGLPFDPSDDVLRAEVTVGATTYSVEYPPAASGDTLADRVANLSTGDFTLADLNLMQINVVLRNDGATLTLTDVTLDGNTLGTGTFPGVFSGTQSWTVTDYDFSNGFTLTGTIQMSAPATFPGGNELSKIDISVGHLNICGNAVIEPAGANGPAESCEDGNAVSGDCCSSACVLESIGSGCSDGQFCTDGDACDGAGTCVAGPARDCSGAADQCNLGVCNETADACEAQPTNEGGTCEDGAFCTVGEICSGGVCTGAARDCSDPIPCTLDACDENADQCTNVLQGNCCGNGGLDPGEECDDGNVVDGDGCEADCTVSTVCSTQAAGNEVFVNDDTGDGTPAGCATPGFATIQAAINAVQDGDVISVCPGTYVEPLVITKEVWLRSTDGSAATVVESGGTTMSVERSRVRVEGLTIRGLSTAITAEAICRPGQTSCAAPGEQGSNVTITANAIEGSISGVTWHGKIDCVAVTNNAFADNGRHLALVQTALTATPAVLVDVSGNTFDRSGTSGPAVEVYGMQATLQANRISDSSGIGLRVGGAVVLVAAGTVEGSGAAGIVVDGAPAGTQILENDIRSNVGDGITVGAAAVAVRILNNNIEENGTGLGNEASSGVLDATLNWWDSQSGPSGLFTGTGDSIVNRSGATTDFLEFLCKPFPQGFPSVLGVCSTETAELRYLYPGSNPDIDPVGGFIAFESTADLDVDPRTGSNNSDGSQEIFLLRKTTRRSIGGVCLGGVTAGSPCVTNLNCPADPNADPIVLNGDCVLLTQVSDAPAVGDAARYPRVATRGKAVTFDSSVDLIGDNGDGSSEGLHWVRKSFEKSLPGFLSSLTASATDSQNASLGLTGRRAALESYADFAGQNGDGNREIFLIDLKHGTWTQLTDSVAPADNRRPATSGTGKQILFDSTADLDNDPDTSVNNADGNWEVFLARRTLKGFIFTQITDTVAPVENRAGSLAKRGKIIVFGSNGDLIPGSNPDGNREIFRWSRGTLTQLTHSQPGNCTATCTPQPDCQLECGNVNPAGDRFGRFVTFESTEDLENDGASNRRVFLYRNNSAVLLRLSRSRFGDNRSPRISNGRFVVWDSTANLTGQNPQGDRVIYLFDQRKDD